MGDRNREQIPNTPRFPPTTPFRHSQFLKPTIPEVFAPQHRHSTAAAPQTRQVPGPSPRPLRPAPPSPAAGGAPRRRTRRCSPSPRRRRSPRHEDGASLTPAGSAAASQLPPLLTSRESVHTETSTGALGSSTAALRRKSNGYASGRSCRGALLLYTGRPAAPPQPHSRPGIHAVNEEQPRETIHCSQEKFICTIARAVPSRTGRGRYPRKTRFPP